MHSSVVLTTNFASMSSSKIRTHSHPILIALSDGVPAGGYHVQRLSAEGTSKCFKLGVEELE